MLYVPSIPDTLSRFAPSSVTLRGSGIRPGEQFFGKVPVETRASLSSLLRERSLSPGE